MSDAAIAWLEARFDAYWEALLAYRTMRRLVGDGSRRNRSRLANSPGHSVAVRRLVEASRLVESLRYHDPESVVRPMFELIDLPQDISGMEPARWPDPMGLDEVFPEDDLT